MEMHTPGDDGQQPNSSDLMGKPLLNDQPVKLTMSESNVRTQSLDYKADPELLGIGIPPQLLAFKADPKLLGKAPEMPLLAESLQIYDILSREIMVFSEVTTAAYRAFENSIAEAIVPGSRGNPMTGAGVRTGRRMMNEVYANTCDAHQTAGKLATVENNVYAKF